MTKSVTFLEFKNLFEAEVQDIFNKEKAEEIMKQVNWDDLLFKPGHSELSNLYDFSNVLIDEAKSYAKSIINGQFPDKFNEVFYGWNNKIRLVFLNFIHDDLSSIQNNNIEGVYLNLRDKLNLNQGNNAEVMNIWFQIGLKLKQKSAIEPCGIFLSSVGRIRYLSPLYKDLHNLDKEQTIEIFKSHK